MYLGIKGLVLQLILALELAGVSLFHGQSFLAAWRGGKASRCPYPWVVKWQGRGLWCHSDKSPAGLRSEPTSCLQVMHFPLPRDGSLINLGKSPRFGKRPNFLRISFSAPFPKSIANSSEGQSASYLWRYYSIQWKPVEGCSSRHQIVIWNCFWFDKLNQSTNSETAMLSS